MKLRHNNEKKHKQSWLCQSRCPSAAQKKRPPKPGADESLVIGMGRAMSRSAICTKKTRYRTILIYFDYLVLTFHCFHLPLNPLESKPGRSFNMHAAEQRWPKPSLRAVKPLPKPPRRRPLLLRPRAPRRPHQRRRRPRQRHASRPPRRGRCCRPRGGQHRAGIL